MKRSVGLILVTDVPGLGRAAVLQVRAPWNTEKGKPQKFAYGCQVTAHGGLEDGEELLQALAREVEEELGSEFMDAWDVDDLNTLLEVSRVSESDKEVVTFAAEVPWDVVKQIRFNPDAAGLRFLLQEHVSDIQDLEEFRDGVESTRMIAMHGDEKEAVTRAFEFFPGA